MSKSRYLSPTILFFILLAMSLSCSDVFDNATLVSSSAGYKSRVNGKYITFTVSTEILADSPNWSLGEKLPLDFETAALIAEKEITNYVQTKELWSLAGIWFKRLEPSNKWYYVVQFNRKMRRGSNMDSDDYLMIPVLLDGKPIKGTR